MIRDHFRVLKVDLSTGRGQIEEIEGRNIAREEAAWRRFCSAGWAFPTGGGKIRSSR